MQNVSWDDLRLLIHAARFDTLQEAARAAGLATTTLSRRIAQLESSLQAPLVVRTHQGIRWTRAGQAVVSKITPLAMQLDQSVREAMADEQVHTGTIRLSAVEGLVPLVLACLAQFRAMYPRVTVDLDCSHRPLDVMGAEVDMGLRTLKPQAQGMVVRKVVSFDYGLYASAQTPLPRGQRLSAAWLAHQPAIYLGQELHGLKENQWLRSRAPTVAMCAPTLSAQIAAVALGLGVAVLPDPLARGDARLKRLGPTDASLGKTLWLAMGRAAARAEPVRALADLLTERLRHGV